MKTRINIIIAALFAAFLSNTHAGPAGLGFSDWARSFDNRVTTEKAAMECCLPKEKVALVCKDCKTVNEKPGTDKNGVLGWFKADSTHDCSGCGGKITVTTASVKGLKAPDYKHVCSKCGENSALICGTHKKS